MSETRTKRHHRMRRFLWLPLGMVVLLAVLLVLLPLLGRWALLNTLEQQGYQATLDDIEVNLWSGRLAGKSFRADRPGQQLAFEKAVLSWHWSALLRREPVFVSITLEGLDLAFGETAPAGEASESPVEPSNTGAWLPGLAEVTLRDSRICQTRESVRNCLSIERLDWQGEARLSSATATSLAELPLQANGHLSVHELAVTETGQASRLTLKQLDINSTQLATLASISLQDIRLEKFTFSDRQGNTVVRFDELSLDQISLAGLQNFELGNLSSRQFAFKPGGPSSPAWLRLQKLDWQGKAHLDTTTIGTPLPELGLRMEGGLHANKLSLTGPGEQTLLSLQSLAVNSVQLASLGSIKLRNIQLANFVAPRETGEPFAGFDRLAVNRAGMNQLQHLEFDTITMRGLGLDLVREQAGHWQVVEHLKPLMSTESTRDPTAATAKQAASGGLPVSIGQLVVEQSAELRIVDRTLVTPFVLSLQELALSARHFDSRRPEQAVGLELDSRIDRHGTLQLRGDVYPLRDELFFDLQVQMQGIDMRPAGAYLEQYLGHQVKSGQLSGDATLAAKAGKLDGVANVELQQFYLLEVDQQQVKKLTNLLGSPLTAALALLREKDNSISLQVPISGDISDPQFDPRDAYMQLVTRAVAVAVNEYYTDYGLAIAGLGQYGLALKGAQKLYGFLNQLRFNDITFDAGQEVISQDQQTYLDELGKMLKERPEVHLTLCGYVTPADLLQQQIELASKPESMWTLESLEPDQAQQLLQLANQRADNIKQYLVSRAAIEPKRLIVCAPEYDDDTTELPRVELRL